MTSKPKISIIIRTKNEEKWISHCLKSVFDQKINATLEVIVVDNKSTDHTLEIAKRFPIKKFVEIEDFIPGKAINDGIRASSGDYIVCLSAHCIPQSDIWLKKLLINFDNNKIAGVYGRQLPLTYTDPVDKRDLLIVFGLDKRIQRKDYFFHNANSMIPRSIWEKFPFDENVTNIEDRVWGKKIIDNGFNIVYEPEASVYHHHGLHHGNTNERARKIVSIMEKVDCDSISKKPNFMSIEKINIAAVIPVIGDLVLNSSSCDSFKLVVDQLKKSKYVDN